MAYRGIDWKSEFPKALELGRQGKTLAEIGAHFGVSRQRIKQLFQHYHVDPKTVGVSIRASRRRDEVAHRLHQKWGNRDQDFYAEKRQKYSNKKAHAKRLGIDFTVKFSELDFPSHCPILGLELDYFAEGRQENSLSFDRIDPSKGYVPGNVILVSWRANRIKNDGTADEHRMIADYIDSITKTE